MKIKYYPVQGSIASSCTVAEVDGTLTGSGCNKYFSCCRAVTAENDGKYKCYPSEPAYFAVNNQIECWALKLAVTATSALALLVTM